MAEIARACWPESPDPWTPEMIAAQLASGTTFAVCRDRGFAMVRVAGEEAEILSLDVLPEARRQGLGHEILTEAMAQARARGAREMYLEVDTGNAPARALYAKAGFSPRGTRVGYYRAKDGTRSDALVMARFFGNPDTVDAQGAVAVRD